MILTKYILFKFFYFWRYVSAKIRDKVSLGIPNISTVTWFDRSSIFLLFRSIYFDSIQMHGKIVIYGTLFSNQESEILISSGFLLSKIWISNVKQNNHDFRSTSNANLLSQMKNSKLENEVVCANSKCNWWLFFYFLAWTTRSMYCRCCREKKRSYEAWIIGLGWSFCFHWLKQSTHTNVFCLFYISWSTLNQTHTRTYYTRNV